MPRSFQAIAMELALLAAGHRFPRLSQVGAAAWGDEEGPPTRVDLDPPVEQPRKIRAPDINGYSFFLLDITYTDDGKIRLIEANGSNAALSSSIIAHDDQRAHHMYLSYMSKVRRDDPAVALFAYQPKILHLAEFFGRAAIFAEYASKDVSTRLCNTEEPLGAESLSVVCGSIPALAENVERADERLFYKGRPIVFGTNPNLLAELRRRDTIRALGNAYDVDITFYHEGYCTPLVHDKGLQQKVTNGSGIEPLHVEDAVDLTDCVTVIRRFHAAGMVAVGKMNAGSGGSGIDFFPPTLSDHEINARLGRLVTSATTKYGPSVLNSMFPVRFFEFAKSTNYDLYGRGHLWDLRVQCLVYPGFVAVTPCVIRLCPEPFDPVTYEWNGVVSNLTGRDPSRVGRFLRSPAAQRRSQPKTVLESIGVSPKIFETMLESCAKWCENAWRESLMPGIAS